MSREINHNNLTYNPKGSSPSISFNKFEGPMYTYNQFKNGNKISQQVEEEQKDFKSAVSEITSRDPKHKKKESVKYNKKCYKSLNFKTKNN